MDRQKMITVALLALETGVLIIVLIFGAVSNASSDVKNLLDDKGMEQVTDSVEAEETMATEEGTDGENAGVEVVVPSTEERQVFSAEVEQKLASMTTEEKVLQMFIVSPETLTGVGQVTIAGNGTKSAIEQYPIGGIVYSQMNFVGLVQAESLIKGSQGFSQSRIGLPLFVVISEDAPSYVGLATLGFSPMENGFLALERSQAPVISDGIKVCSLATETEVVIAIQDGMDMVYAPNNFMEIYGAVLTAVNDGMISQVRLENAVGRVLTEKMQ